MVVNNNGRVLNECEFTRKICNEMERLCGAEVYPLVGGMRGKNKWPDRLIIHRDFMGLVEFKGITGKLMPAQAAIIKRLNRKRLGTAFVVKQLSETTASKACSKAGFAGSDDVWYYYKRVDNDARGEAWAAQVFYDGELLGGFDTGKELLAILADNSKWLS